MLSLELASAALIKVGSGLRDWTPTRQGVLAFTVLKTEARTSHMPYETQKERRHHPSTA